MIQLLGLLIVVHGLPAASKLQTVALTAMRTDCVAISVNVNDYWCQTMCPTGQCPEDMCKCGASPSPSASEANINATRFAVRNLTQDVGDVPLVIIGEDGACKSLSDSASDEWCTSTCKGNMANCPKMCDCSTDNKERVDVDPIQVNNGDVKVPVAATSSTGSADIIKCRSLSPAATDEWCAHSCGTGNCPETMCQCGDNLEEPPAAGSPAFTAAPEPASVAAAQPVAVPVSAQSPSPIAPASVDTPVPLPSEPAVPVPMAEPVVAAPASAAAPVVPVAEPAEATPAIDASKCVATSPAATQEWCVLTCGTGSCPESLCDCNGNAEPSPAAATAGTVPAADKAE